MGAVVGMLVVSQLRSNTLQAIFGILALIFGVYMSVGRVEWRLGQEMPKGLLRFVLSPLDRVYVCTDGHRRGQFWRAFDEPV